MRLSTLVWLTLTAALLAWPYAEIVRLKRQLATEYDWRTRLGDRTTRMTYKQIDDRFHFDMLKMAVDNLEYDVKRLRRQAKKRRKPGAATPGLRFGQPLPVIWSAGAEGTLSSTWMGGAHGLPSGWRRTPPSRLAGIAGDRPRQSSCRADLA